MLDADIPVWYRFLEKWGHSFLNLYYDCLLGGPYLLPGEEKDPLKKMWRHNLSKRADAIAELEKEVWIIEAASHPGLRAIGQCVAYQSLWLEDPKIAKIERPVLVCEVLDTDVGAVCGRMGVMVFIC
ncbi:MAG: hypothetical protein CEE41_05170 [Hadesarchaea archaeon B3_Hades]|nr:MAG: hypothetical protein CEE41_05170 [Hadesarchaea archaeon B3_Hades]